MPPDGSSVTDQGPALLLAAVWIERLLLGSIGGSIALIAVALLGFAMLQGRLSFRDGMRVVLGCFILFGAPAIAAGIVQATATSFQRASGRGEPEPSPRSPRRAPDFDPYAGAALPPGQRTWP